ncbi:TIGR03619 family F420-dependent LLM class oxidoreductase [Aldersonia kunmingensis]|uniref:TIGR03619 family F420-dependent LLM class oxidoreductase n=1 Tax=Aldersonia kunmingensis TaxID=408066 RepID=UPI00082EA40E|nr:TIGR03619 family F420-dependent LLM class oxidoreductase [Aldersonia kunmingensis]
MDIGFGLPVSGSWATPGNIVEISRRAEELGYSTLWTYQRILVAESTPLGPQYASVLDPVAALSFAAAVTERIRLGTGIVNVPFQAPAILGKQLATLDVLSGGRLDAGLGLGWSEDEFIAADADYSRRGARGAEYISALRAVWGADPVEFAGEFYRVPRSKIQPKPVQQPHPPIILGGSAPVALQRAGRLADGWMSSSHTDLTAIGEQVEIVKVAAREAGRDESQLRFICRGVLRNAERSKPLSGSFDEIRGDLDLLARNGITETFLDLNFDPTVGNPDADPIASMRWAHKVLDALAPTRA